MYPSRAKRAPPSSLSRIREGSYKGKVCVICNCNLEYTLFVLDFDTVRPASVVSTSPTLRFHEELGSLCFCVLDTRLYVIGADDGDIKSDHKELWVSEYNLLPHMSDSAPKNCLVDMSLLKSCLVSPMNADKSYPLAVPTLDGRVLVYPKNIFTFVKSTTQVIETEYADFEIYDPKQKRWQTLPQLFLLGYDDNRFFVRDRFGRWILHPNSRFLSPCRSGTYPYSHINTRRGTFIAGSSTFLLTLEIGLMFTIDICLMEEGWQPYHDVDVASSSTEFLIIDHIVVSPSWVKDLRDIGSTPISLPDLLPTGTSFKMFRTPDFKILLLDYMKAHESVSCTVTSAYVRDQFPFLMCTTYSHDISPSSEGDDISPGAEGGVGPTLLNCFKFPFAIECDFLCIVDAFLMAYESSVQTKRLSYDAQTEKKWLTVTGSG